MEDVSPKNATQIFGNQTDVDRRYATFALKTGQGGEIMDWLELVWNIVSVWAICAGCLTVFVATFKL
jgi:hypothetical protein